MSEPDLTAEELIAEYEGGRRDFSNLRLDGIDLASKRLDEASFFRSSLRGADLSNAIFRRVDFQHADLTDASLSAAVLAECDLYAAVLRGAECRHSRFVRVSLDFVTFVESDLTGAYVGGTTLVRTDLTGANLAHTSLGLAYLVDVDVTPLCDARFLVHENPSYVDVRTVMKSYKHPRLKSFMVDCGVPEVFAEYMIECAKAVGDDLLQELMQSTFISYGAPDEAFARRLYDALRANRVVTFFFPETARVGERIGDEVFNALQRHDRMILVCSRASLDRPGVLNEVRETLDREARDGGATYLIPVMLDDYLLTDWKEVQPELAERVGRRVAADFSGTESDPDKFDAALSRLLAALRKKGPG